MSTSKEMPKYICHKEVHALKIVSVSVAIEDPSGLLEFGGCWGALEVSAEYMTRHEPESGGYYVVYADGYESYSPAEPFEAGYTACSGKTATTFKESETNF